MTVDSKENESVIDMEERHLKEKVIELKDEMRIYIKKNMAI